MWALRKKTKLHVGVEVITADDYEEFCLLGYSAV
jgi:hypothetical protein